MNPCLLYEDRAISSQEFYAFHRDLSKDLNLNIVYKTMAREQSDIYEAVQKVLLSPLHSENEILYRQQVVMDTVENGELLWSVYEKLRRVQGDLDALEGTVGYARGKMVDERNLLIKMVDIMKEIYACLNTQKESFRSCGFRKLLETISAYDWNELSLLVNNLDIMVPGGELTISCSLGRGLKLEQVSIADCKSGGGQKSSVPARFAKVVHLVSGDEVIYVDGETMENEVHHVKEVALQHILLHFNQFSCDLRVFMKNLYFELSFYLGCSHLYTRFQELEIPLCMPTVSKEQKKIDFVDLYELTLAIYTREKPVPNTLSKLGDKLFLITGANQGGKSTFLRSFGIAQVMFQSGIFVPALSFTGQIYDNIFTHFARREDQQMNRGRLEEEVHRMDQIISKVTDQSLLLLNESFASTTEKEGSVIAEDLSMALYEQGVDVFMVTHLFEFARKMWERNLSHAVFLTAERLDNGTRTFKMIEHVPNHTSYGLDLYDAIIEKG